MWIKIRLFTRSSFPFPDRSKIYKNLTSGLCRNPSDICPCLNKENIRRTRNFCQKYVYVWYIGFKEKQGPSSSRIPSVTCHCPCMVLWFLSQYSIPESRPPGTTLRVSTPTSTGPVWVRTNTPGTFYRPLLDSPTTPSPTRTHERTFSTTS